MKKIIIDLKNCYGIKELKIGLDFSVRKLLVVYAPNGAMKTSFAKTFQDLSSDQESGDRIFKTRESKRNIKDESGLNIDKEQVFVIEPYNQNYKSSKISNLLVNKTLKDEYDGIYSSINDKKDVLIKELKSSSGLKKDIEETFSDAITHDSKEFFQALTRVNSEVLEGKTTALDGIPYQKIFNDRVLELLESPELKKNLSEYMKVYDRLISASTFFKKGVFNHNNASEIAKNLKNNGFFKASHSVNVNFRNIRREIKTEAELEEVIKNEKDSILGDSTLKTSFDEIDTQLAGNKGSKDFREFLDQNKSILPELDNLPRLKQKLWIAYLTKSLGAYKDLMEVYTNGKEKIEAVINRAKEEETKWKSVIDIFNERFSVPFVVTMENQDDVILKRETPSIKFKFKNTDNNPDMPVEEGTLWPVLSNGEKRALYLLNIIFEVEARKDDKKQTLFIVDDIADSFDYKNKYAIVEYLNDISREDYFYQVILTHNFDFYRTLCSRLSVPRANRLHTVKTTTSIRLVEEKYQNNPFATWKDNLAKEEMLVASIPFVRNLAEYCGFPNHFKTLTSLLHLKPETPSITVGDLQKIIKEVLRDKADLVLADHDRKVKNLIYGLADGINLETEEIIELEKKIVLSIAIRLKTEELLIKEISDDAFVRGIEKNQTIVLIDKFKKKCPSKIEIIKLAEQVNLMTPANIHINSFMYEPILDMSNDHLKQLYKKVCDLSKER